MKRWGRRIAFFFVAVVIVAASVVALYRQGLYVRSEAPSQQILIRGGTIFDGTGRPALPNDGILIADGRIQCLGSHCGREAGGRVVLDASGLAIVPGLIDLHVHFVAQSEEIANKSVPKITWNMAQLRPDVRRKLLESGVTTVRSVGDPRDMVLELKQMLETGEVEGPRMFVAGPIFTAPGGHPTINGQDPNGGGFGGSMTFQSNDPAEIARAISELSDAGADGIKAVYHRDTSAVEQDAQPTLSIGSLETIAREADARGMWVAIHVGPKQETKTVAALGVTTIEHGVRAGNVIDKTTAQLLAEQGVVYVPTLGNEPQGYLNIEQLVAMGVLIGVGTDVNKPEMTFGGSYHDELERLVMAGMDPEDVLVSATQNGARGLLMSDQLGTIEQGKLADLVVTDGEPWNDISDLRDVVFVISRGNLIVR